MIRKLAPWMLPLALVATACGQTNITVTAVEPEEGGFFTQIVDFSGDVGHGLALATDAEGNPHVSYVALAAEEAGPEAGPSPTPVPGPTGTPGATPSPAETVLGVPTLPAVMHAHLVENVLTRSGVADALSRLTAEDETAIAVDTDGIHHVAWTEGGSSLWYANNAEEGVFSEPQQIPLVGDQVTGVSMAADDRGTVYVAFMESTGVEGPGAIVRLGTRTPQGDASVETVAEAGETGPTAVRAGGQGVFVAFGDGGRTLVARQDGAAWASEVVDEDGGYAVSMAVDTEGNPHVAYANGAGDIKHAHSIDGGAWEISIVGSAGFAPSEQDAETGIAVDGDGVHHVAWTDATGISYSNNAEGPFARGQQIPGTETTPAAEAPRVGVGREGTVFIAWFDPEGTEVQLTQRGEDAPPLALPSPSPTPAGAPGDGQIAPCEPEGTDLTVIAQGLQFSTDCLAAPAGEPFTIEFSNEDAQPHNVAIYTEAPPAGEELFVGETFPGPETRTYDVEPIEEPGEFYFQCDVHPTMNGTFVAADEGGGGDGGGGGGGS